MSAQKTPGENKPARIANGRSPGPAASPASRQNGAVDGVQSYRPLTMERRTTRYLPHEAEKQMQELESLAQSLIQQQEEKQQTISRELHDNVAQVLAAVTNRMSLARTTSKVPAWLRQELLDLQESLDAALTDIRTLARELRPSLLDHCGFSATLQKHAQDFRERTGMEFDLQVDPAAADFLDSAGLTHLFRLVQEAMQNVEEHSGAARAWLKLARRGDAMDLEIGDDGQAFDSERIIEAQADGHLGLLGMRERAELLGGFFLLESFPGRGTTVRVRVPLARSVSSPDYLI